MKSLFDHSLTPSEPPAHVTLHRLNALPSSGSLYRKALFGRRAGLKRGERMPAVGVIAPWTVSTSWLERYLSCCGWRVEGELEAPIRAPMTVGQVCAAPVQSALLMGSLSPLSPLGLVHASNEVLALQPLPLDRPLEIMVWFGETSWRDRGVSFDIHTTLRAEGSSSPLWIGRTTVFKALHPDKEALKARAHTKERPLTLRERVESQGEERGQTLRELTLSLPADMGRRYAPIAQDHNPIHLYAWSARLFGFKSAIMHGMWSVGRALAEGSPNPSEVATGELRVSFKRPLPLPSAPSLQLAVEHPSEGSPAEFELYTAEGKLSLEGAWVRGSS